ncbi:MAG: hypothetical protein L0287_34155, partial [Anaerolineae bacterium]|nr:hypothetical protein [Anaerolineae bacterium]
MDQILDGKDEIDLALSLQPDVNLMYLKLPGVNCLEAMLKIRKRIKMNSRQVPRWPLAAFAMVISILLVACINSE